LAHPRLAPRAALPALDQAVRDRLLGREVFVDGQREPETRGRAVELRRYVDRSAGRLAASLRHVDALAARTRATRVLEIGADPWFMTQLIVERGTVPTVAGKRPGLWREDESASSPREVRLRWDGMDVGLEQHLFDVERDRWPFADESFDLVVCAEVIEHLVFSPAHMLYEANRVLRHGGGLLVATPNAVAGAKRAAMARGRNVWAAYSGHGPYGRHNREFTPGEVELVLRLAGFSAEIVLENLAGYETAEPLGRALQAVARAPLAATRRLRDHIFASALKVAPPSYAFPEELYRVFDPERMRLTGAPLPDER
jgi:SAM-dependent methyltransferase